MISLLVEIELGFKEGEAWDELKVSRRLIEIKKEHKNFKVNPLLESIETSTDYVRVPVLRP